MPIELDVPVISDKQKEVFNKGWEEIKSYILGHDMAEKCDVERLISDVIKTSAPKNGCEQIEVYSNDDCIYRYCPHPHMCKAHPNGCNCRVQDIEKYVP